MTSKKISGKRNRTIYNPKVGCKYLIENLESGEVIEASTLTIRDPDQKPWRSPMGTKAGEEFFKMKSGTKRGEGGFTYYKFMNSILVDRSYSDDGKWVFLGKTADGHPVNRSDEEPIAKKEYKQVKLASANSANTTTTSTMEVTETLTVEDIRDEVVDTAYGDTAFLDDLLKD